MTVARVHLQTATAFLDRAADDALNSGQ